MNLTTDESTHLQMASALEEQAREIEAMAAEEGRPLNYWRLTMVNKSRELARIARAQLRAAGVICHQREVV